MLLTAEEARARTEAIIKKKTDHQLDDITAGIRGAMDSGHYHYLYDGIIDEVIKNKLKSIGYKILPPNISYHGTTTQIEW
jgi:hypothetical protein